jgi:hypothetical protein
MCFISVVTTAAAAATATTTRQTTNIPTMISVEGKEGKKLNYAHVQLVLLST